MDYIDFPYIGTMRAFDGSTFQVAWVPVPSTNDVVYWETPFRSGRWDPYAPFDLGFIGEIPEYGPPRSRQRLPSRVCSNCYLGDIDWWENGWPSDAPVVEIAPDGFPVGCTSNPPLGAPFNCGFDFGFQSPLRC